VRSAQTRTVIVLSLIRVGAAAVAAVVGREVSPFLMVELTMLAVSVKIIYVIHRQMHISHFKS
jgi:hypothetical protein